VHDRVHLWGTGNDEDRDGLKSKVGKSWRFKSPTLISYENRTCTKDGNGPIENAF
jgi:hypothetical protein